jgi:hypothetical protein
VSRVDVYAGAPQAGSAQKFGTMGITFRARKPIDAGEWARAVEGLRCEVNARPG